VRRCSPPTTPTTCTSTTPNHTTRCSASRPAATIDDPNRFKFSSDQHYLKTADEMRYLFSEVPTACDNTLWIAERCNVEIEFGRPKLPAFPLPDGFATDTEYLAQLTKEDASSAGAARSRPTSSNASSTSCR